MQPVWVGVALLFALGLIPAGCASGGVAGAPTAAGTDDSHAIGPRPGSRPIRLPIARLKATSPNPKPDPIVYLAGGPGGASPLITKAARTWNRDRDVILFVQRGTLEADPFLSCVEVDDCYTALVGLSWEDPATATKHSASTP